MKEIVCRECGVPTPKTGPSRRYCPKCSTARDIARKAAHSNGRGKVYGKEAQSRIAIKGREISASNGTIPDFDEPVRLAWTCRANVPFNWAGSKNHIFTSRPVGYSDLRVEANVYRLKVIRAVESALCDRKVAQNKLWLDIIVQKPSHRGDAANLLDMVCDAVKVATGLDDRWFSVRRIDWQIVKTDPMLIIQIGQETTDNVQACSSCGRLLLYDQFHSNKGQKTGIGRNCRDCSTARPGIEVREMIEP